jgi:hypothetical protein
MSNDNVIFEEKQQPNGDILVVVSRQYYSSIVIGKEDIDKYTDALKDFVKKRLQHAIEFQIKKDGLSYMEESPVYYMGNQLIVDPLFNEEQSFLLVHPAIEAKLLQDRHAYVSFKEPKKVLIDERDR